MTYDDAVKEAAKLWGGKGESHLFSCLQFSNNKKKSQAQPYHMVGPEVDTIICQDDKDPTNFGEGKTWEQAFENFAKKTKIIERFESNDLVD
jgi:hypothetical protein